MGIFDIFHRKKVPRVDDRTIGSNYSFFMGTSASGKVVTERTSMQMTAVYACVRILSEAVASLPLHFYELLMMEKFYLLMELKMAVWVFIFISIQQEDIERLLI